LRSVAVPRKAPVGYQLSRCVLSSSKSAAVVGGSARRPRRARCRDEAPYSQLLAASFPHAAQVLAGLRVC